MGKKVEVPSARGLGKRVVRRRAVTPSEESSGSQSSGGQSSGGQSSGGQSSGEQSSGEQSSDSPIPAQNMAIRTMQFRARRGTKMNYLMALKKDEEQDAFWQQHGQTYFGALSGSDDQEEDYVQSSSGRDEFDSDFDISESEHQEKEQEDEEIPRKKAEVKKKSTVKTNTSQSQMSNRYIHQVFTQEQLLGQAASTQYYNWLSLKKLISIESEKKDFARQESHVDGPKCIYRQKIVDGRRKAEYELQATQVHSVAQLTHIWSIQ